MEETENKEPLEESAEETKDISFEELQKQVISLTDSNDALQKRITDLENENLKLKSSLASSRENTTLLLNRFATRFEEQPTETAETLESQILAHYK